VVIRSSSSTSPIRHHSRTAAALAAIVLVAIVGPAGPVGSRVGAAGDRASTRSAEVLAATLGMKPNADHLRLADLRAAEAALGRPIRHTVQMLRRDSPEGMVSSALAQLRAGQPLAIVAGTMGLTLTVPLNFGKTTAHTPTGVAQIRVGLLRTAAGAYDEEYREVAALLAAAGYPDAVVRLGHEMTLPWSPWSAVDGNHDAYRTAFRHVATTMRRVAPRLRFEWAPAVRSFGLYGPPAYPGDDVVDVIGLSVYFRADRDGAWSPQLWQNQLLAPLQQHHAFAKQRRKPVSYPEWGLTQDTPEFVQAMADWFAALPASGDGRLLYQSLFNTGGAYKVSALPRSWAAYVARFGAARPPSPTTTTRPSPTTAVAPSVRLVATDAVEGDTGTRSLPFQVRLGRPASAPLQLTFTVVGGTAGTDDLVSAGPVGVTVPTGAESAWFGVAIRGDVRAEADESVVVQLVSVDGRSPSSTVRATGLVLDDD
jgi:hypothetical protein